ncbi:MAG: PAS domain S-box protein [Chloroflexi bacterium]|nr:PAS domain S-box protein [Chloroflexota bacterium]
MVFEGNHMSGHTSPDLNDLQRLTRPYDSLGDSVIVADKDGIILYANTAATALYGYAAGELLGEPITIFDLEGQSPIDFESIMKAPGQMWEGEVPRVRKDGTEFPALLTVTPFRNLRGEIMGRVGIARDLTKLKEAETSFKKLSRQQTVLAEIGRIVSSTLDIDEVYDRFAELVQGLIPYDRICVSMVNEDKVSTTETYVWGHKIAERQIGTIVNMDKSISGEVYRQRSGVNFQPADLLELESKFPGLGPPYQSGLRSFLAAPLISNDLVIGILHIDSRLENAYTSNDMRTSELVAAQIAGALANARLHADVQQDANEREVLAEIGRVVSSSLDIEEVYERFGELVSQLLPLDNIGLGMIDDSNGTVTYKYTKGSKIPDRDTGPAIPLEKSLTAAVFECRSTILYEPVSEGEVKEKYPRLVPLYETGLRSFLSVPLISHDKVIGVLHTHSKKQGVYDERHLAVAGRVAAQIAGALESSVLHADLQRHANQRTVLAEIGRIASSSLNLSEVYEGIADQVRRLISFDRATVYLVNEKEGTIVATYSAGLEVDERPIGKIESIHGSMTYDAFRSASSRLVQTEDETWFAEHYPVALPSFRAGLRSFISVPLISDNNVIGALSISSATSDAYHPEDVAAAEQVATQLAGAVASSQYSIQRQQAEVALGESTDLYRTLLESAPDGVIITTESGRIELINARVEAMFGYSRSELIGEKVEVLVPANVRKEHNKLRMEYENKPKTRGMEGRLDIIGLRKDGTEFSVDIALSPLRTDRGLLVTSIIRDTTERRHLEEQLLHSQKMEAVGQLAGGVAHDFNNMLSAIISYTHLAQMRSEKGSPINEYLDEVRKAADRASHLTRQLLAFSRRQIVEPRSLNINDIVLELNSMLRRLIGEDIEIVMLPDPDLGFTKVDPGQMEQVIVNLAVNSRDAMPDGGKLTISTFNFTIDDENAREHSVKQKGDYIGLKVEDTGVGMSEEVKAHIFEPFYTTKEVGKGTGLGLSICYGIAEQNGGCISVESEVGKGTAFTMLLPRLEIGHGQSSNMNQLDPLPQGKEKILLVEDEPMVREVTAHVLREQGYTVVEAANGMEAVRAFSEDTTMDIDLLLTDIVMPLMSGRELAEKVKLMHPGIKVLYASGYTDDEIVRREIMTDDRQFIMKPFTPLALTNKVREALDRLHPVA